MLRLQLHEHDTVYVEKGGEIIPKIISVNLDKRKPDASQYNTLLIALFAVPN
jgi:DNA ligase (NAD+)